MTRTKKEDIKKTLEKIILFCSVTLNIYHIIMIGPFEARIAKAEEEIAALKKDEITKIQNNISQLEVESEKMRVHWQYVKASLAKIERQTR